MSQDNTYSYYDLDLDELEKTEDPDKLPGMLSTLITADSDYKILPARGWLEQFLYYAGTRDIVSRLASGTVVNNSVNMSGTQGGMGNISRRRIPKFFKAVQAQASNITRQRPSIKVWPEGDDEKSESKAKLSNLLLDYFWDMDCENDLYYEQMLWSLLSPLAARKDYISYEFNASRLWPKMEKSIDPRTGQPTNTVIHSQDGNPIMEQMPWNKTEIVSAFRLLFNPTASWTTDVDFMGDTSVRRIGWVRQQYLREEEGYLPWNVEKVKPGSWNYTACMALEATIKTLTFGAFRGLRSWNFNSLALKDGTIQLNLFVKPSPKYPHGREIVVVNGYTCYDGPSRIYREYPVVVWHPYSVLCYERVPGRLWGTSYGEKLTDQQRVYEQARSEMDQLRRTFTKPKMAIPIGAQIDRDTVTGNEEIYRYNPFGPGGGVPSFMTPPPASSTLMDDIKLMGQEWTETSGITEIMMGLRPQGVTTYRGLEVLREESNNMQNNPIRMYEACIQMSQWNKLENIRKCLQYPSPQLTNALKVFKKVKQYITDIDVQDFVGDGLAGYVTIEPMSSIGKSRLGLQEKYMSLAQAGILGDVVNDPDLNQEFKRKMDISGFDKPQNKQVLMARYENQQMLQSEDVGQPIVPPIHDFDDDAIHIREIENLQLDPALQNKQFIMAALQTHKQYHQQKQAAIMAQQLAQQQAMMAMEAGMKPEKPKEKSKGNGKGNGSGFATQANLGQGGQQEMLFGPESGGANNMNGML